MKERGRIISFDRFTGWGIIEFYYNRTSHIPFNVATVFRQENQPIILGQVVDFNTREINGNKVAVNIILLTWRKHTNEHQDSQQEKKLKNIIKYNYQNWEEVEKIFEEPKESYTEKDINPEQQTATDYKFLALSILENKIKLVSLTRDGRYNYLDESQKYHNIIYPFHFEEASLAIAIEEFEYLVNSPQSSEADFQDFLERNPNFILNDEYRQAHPHIILAKEGKQSLIPDFVLEPINQNAFCDLLELKLPTSNIFVMKKSRQHFSASITEAAGQLRVYRDYFNETANRNKFQQAYPHLQIYKPKMLLVIGRQTENDALIKRDIQAEYPQLIINNYDDLLARMKWKREKLKSKIL